MSTADEQTAQPRHRRFSRSSKLILAILFFLVALPLGYRAIEVLTPAVGEAFDVEAFCAYKLPDERNAFTHYRKVVELFVGEQKVLDSKPSVKVQDFVDSETAGLEDWSRAIPAVREWVALNRKALDEWPRGADCEESLPVAPDQATTESASAAVGVTMQLRSCSQVEGLEGMRLISEGHPDAAWVCYRNLLRTGRHLAMHGSLMGSFIGGAIHDLGVSGGVVWSSQKSVNAELLRKAIRDVEAVEQMHTPPSDIIKLEYLALREFATTGKYLGTTMTAWVRYTGYPAQVGRTARLVTANLLTQADRPRYLRTAVRPGKLGLYELDPDGTADPKVKPPEEIERSAISSATTVADLLKRVAPEPASEIEVCDPQSMTQSLHYAIQSHDASQTRRSGLLLALALQLYYREHGAFPALLDELVKNSYLKSIPIDPYGKGEPFRYRRETGPQGAAVIWSVWIDGIDQGGPDLRSAGDDWGIRVTAPGTSGAPSKK